MEPMSATDPSPQPSPAAGTPGAVAFDYLARAQFVSLTTFRRDGRGVATPLWIAPDGADLLCWTGLSSAKVKRLRRDHRVTIQICTRGGRIEPGTPLLSGSATVLSAPAEANRALAALRRKYGVQARILGRVAALRDRRADAAGHCAIRIDLDTPAG